MSKFKPVTSSASGISAALKRAGLSRSASHATSVRGWRDTTTGFKVQTPLVGSALALVSYVPKTHGATPEHAEKMLLEYARVLTQHGFRPERTAYSGEPKDDGSYLSVHDRDLRSTLREAGEFLCLSGGGSLPDAGYQAIAASVSGDKEAMNQAALRINTGFRHLRGAPLERLQGTPLKQAANA